MSFLNHMTSIYIFKMRKKYKYPKCIILRKLNKVILMRCNKIQDDYKLIKDV